MSAAGACTKNLFEAICGQLLFPGLIVIYNIIYNQYVMYFKNPESGSLPDAQSTPVVMLWMHPPARL